MSNDNEGWIDPMANGENHLLEQLGLQLSPSLSRSSTETSLASLLPSTDAKPSKSKKRKQNESRSSQQLPRLAEIVSWPELLQQHAALLENKDQMGGRRFNKTALELLNACVGMVKKGIQLPNNQDALPEDHDWTIQKEALSKFRTIILNEKEQVGEDLVQNVVNYIQQTLPPLLTADEKRETLLKKSTAFMQELSPALAIKTLPVIKSYVAQLFDSHMDQMFAEIFIPDMDIKEKALLYQRMLANFIDDERCVSFMTTNRQLLGKVKAKDVWFLTFFACVTARRARGDNLLQLGCCGKSSVGKSMLFESILLMTGHQILSSATSGSSETGCGRFNLGSKNSIVFHDINIATLVGADLEKVKSLARTENCIAKIHSSTITVAPVFVIYTSNERLFKHFIPSHLTGNGLSATYKSELDELSGKKRVSADNLEAIRARFLEMYCFKTPKQDPQDLEQGGNFERSHFILGTFDRAMALLENYSPTDFHSPHLPAYILSSLAKNLSFVESVMCSVISNEAKTLTNCPQQHRQRLEDLQQKYK